MYQERIQKKRLIVAVGVVAMGLTAASANAGSLVLGNSGWTATWDSSHDGYLDLAVDGIGNSTVFIEKGLNYIQAQNADGSFDPVVVTFQQTSPDALPFIAINDEVVVNQSGTDWTGFQMSLDGAAFDGPGSQVGQSGGFSIDPFTQHSFSLGQTVLNVSGGTLANGAVWFPGVASGSLIIVSPATIDGTGSFTLSEMPGAGGPTPVIPLPAAFWSGLLGLGGLGIIGMGRKVQKKLV